MRNNKKDTRKFPSALCVNIAALECFNIAISEPFAALTGRKSLYSSRFCDTPIVESRYNKYIVLEKTIEYWKQKHREYSHAHDDERKAYYQAYREHYKDYNHNHYLAHRDEIRRRQAERRHRIKLEKELRQELLCRLVNILSNL